MGLQLPISAIFSMAGILDDIEILNKESIVHHNVVHTDDSNGISRVIHLQISNNDVGGTSARADYLLHSGQENNQHENIFEFKFDADMHVVEASVAGQKYGDDQRRKLLKIVKNLRERIGVHKEWANFVKIIEAADLDGWQSARSTWSGLSQDGEIKAIQPHLIESTSEPVFPALFMPGFLGCGPEYYSGDKQKTQSFHVRDPDAEEDVILNYNYSQGQAPLHIKMSCSVTRVTDDEWKEYPLYELTAGPCKENDEYGKIKSFKLHHANAANGQLDTIDLQNPKNVAIALKAIRMMNRLVRASETGFRSELEKASLYRRLYLPNDIRTLTGLDDIMMPKTPAPARGRFCFTPMGGQNTKVVFSDFDKHIGGNSYRFDYYESHSSNAESLITDMGILFHDDFDLSFRNLSAYFKHKNNKSHKPRHHVRAIMFTHRHKDHISQLAYLVKHGYELPPIIMPPLAVRQIQREMAELKIDKEIRKQILKKCVVLDHKNISPQASSDNPDKKSVAGENLEIFWENLEGERLNQFERFPVVRVGNFTIRVGSMPHSDPGFMYEVKTPVSSHLHTGDFKLDPTIQFYQPSFKTWLNQCEASTLSVDSTGATRGIHERTPWESEIQDSLVQVFKENPDNRFICPVLGSNTARMTTLIAAMGAAGKTHLVVDGLALEHLVDDLNSIHDFKKWAKREHGVTIAKKGSKEADRIYAEEAQSSYVLAVTGTQLEAPSSLNRAIAGWLPHERYAIGENDIICPLQGPIPVGDNMHRRYASKYFAEVFYGCKFILPEQIEKESDLKLSGSGHASPMDLKNLYGYLKNLHTVFPVHGGPDQLEAGKNIAEESGYSGIIADNFDNYQLKKSGPIQKFLSESSEMVGVRTQNTAPYAFWMKRLFSTTVAPVAANDNSPTGQALSLFEKALCATMKIPRRGLLAEAARFHLSRTFNMSAQGGFLTGRYKFGVEKHTHDIYTEKAIGALAGFDTETTGTDSRFDFIDQFSMKAWSLTKKVLFETELKQKIPDYTIRNPEASLVTVTEPDQKDNREVHPVLFTDQILDNLKNLKTKAKKLAAIRLPEMFDKNPSTRAKAVLVAHNLPFDDRQLKALFKDTLLPEIRPHASNGIIGIDTIHLARAVHAVYPDKIKVRKKTDSDYLDFTLQALCEENGVSYDLSKAHNSALYDSERAMKLFWKLEEAAPEMVAQMIFNADTSTDHLLNDMIGFDTGIKGPHPVFSYLSNKRDRTDMRMGCYVGTLDNGTKVVVANLSKNPQDVLSLSPADIAERLSDKNNDSLEIIDLRQNPMIFPAKYFYEVNSAKRHPRERFDRRARMVKEYLNFRDADLDMTNIHERLADAWDRRKMDILKKFEMLDRAQPDLETPSLQIMKDAHNHITAMRSDSARATASRSFNPISQNTGKALRAYREALVGYLEADNSEKGNCKDNLDSAYRKLMKSTKPSPGQSFLVNNIHYDLDPSALTLEARTEIEGYRASHAKYTAERAIRVLDKLESDEDYRNEMIGNSLKKRKIFQSFVDKKDDLIALATDAREAAKGFIMPWRKSRNMA